MPQPVTSAKETPLRFGLFEEDPFDPSPRQCRGSGFRQAREGAEREVCALSAMFLGEDCGFLPQAFQSISLSLVRAQWGVEEARVCLSFDGSSGDLEALAGRVGSAHFDFPSFSISLSDSRGKEEKFSWLGAPRNSVCSDVFHAPNGRDHVEDELTLQDGSVVPRKSFEAHMERLIVAVGRAPKECGLQSRDRSLARLSYCVEGAFRDLLGAIQDLAAPGRLSRRAVPRGTNEVLEKYGLTRNGELSPLAQRIYRVSVVGNWRARRPKRGLRIVNPLAHVGFSTLDAQIYWNSIFKNHLRSIGAVPSGTFEGQWDPRSHQVFLTSLNMTNQLARGIRAVHATVNVIFHKGVQRARMLQEMGISPIADCLNALDNGRRLAQISWDHVPQGLRESIAYLPAQGLRWVQSRNLRVTRERVDLCLDEGISLRMAQRFAADFGVIEGEVVGTVAAGGVFKVIKKIGRAVRKTPFPEGPSVPSNPPSSQQLDLIPLFRESPMVVPDQLVRQLTWKDLGLSKPTIGKKALQIPGIPILYSPLIKGVIELEVESRVATVWVDFIVRRLQTPLQNMVHLKKTAKRMGADTLVIYADVINEKLLRVLQRRFDFVTVPGTGRGRLIIALD